MSQRRFGIELEFGWDCKNLPDGLRPACPRECYYCEDDYDEDGKMDTLRLLLQKEDCRGWDVGWDGTEIELRSPILQGNQGFKELKKVVKLLNDTGGYCTEDDGTHVHIDAPEFVNNGDNLLKLVRSWVANEKVIDCYTHPERINSWAAPKMIGPEDIEKVEQEGSAFRKSERGALNTNALREHGSIEFRQHEGTLDYDRIEAWIMFGQRFLDNVLRRKEMIRCANDPSELLSILRMPAKAKARLEQNVRDLWGVAPAQAVLAVPDYSHRSESVWY